EHRMLRAERGHGLLAKAVAAQRSGERAREGAQFAEGDGQDRHGAAPEAIRLRAYAQSVADCNARRYRSVADCNARVRFLGGPAALAEWRRAPSGSTVTGLVGEAELVELPGHLAPLGRHVAIQPPALGIASRLGLRVALLGAGAELFQVRHAGSTRRTRRGCAADQRADLSASEPPEPWARCAARDRAHVEQ